MKTMLQSMMMLLVFTIITGGLYPLGVTVVAQLAWPHESNGSLNEEKQKVQGSELIAQKFVSQRYFWPRPSASEYATIPSSASNLGPTSAALKQRIVKRREELARAHESDISLVPEDLLTTSASGLDPHISKEAARFQIGRVAKARGLDALQIARLNQIVDRQVEGPQWGLFGEPRVNVLLLNLMVDKAFPIKAGTVGS